MGGVIISVCSDQGGVGGLVFGEVGVTVWLHSRVDMISIIFPPRHNVTDIPSLKSESHGSNPG